MKQIAFSSRLLFKDFKNNLYYLTMISIVSAAAFIFSNIANNSALKVEMEVNQFGNFIPRYSEFVIMIDIGFTLFLAVYAYLYSLKKKSLELKIIKVSGGSWKKMTIFLMIQNIILLIMGSVIGLLLGLMINPLINLLIYRYLNLPNSCFEFSFLAIIDSFRVNLLTLVVTTLLASGYIYRNEIKNLSIKETNWTKDRRVIRFPSGFHILLYLSGIVMFLTTENEKVLLGGVAYAVIGCLGAAGLIRKKVGNVLIKKASTDPKPDKINFIALRSIYYTLKRNFILILALLFSTSVMMVWTLGKIDQPIDFIIAFISYLISLILLYSSTFSMYLADFKTREDDQVFLWKCGYALDDLKMMIKKEIGEFYLIIFTFSIIYMLLMVIRVVLVNSSWLLVGLLLLLIYLIISVTMMILTIVFVTKNIEKRIVIKDE